eukprot:12239030-Alexandrium_andersonii.AAC.1
MSHWRTLVDCTLPSAYEILVGAVKYELKISSSEALSWHRGLFLGAALVASAILPKQLWAES